MSRPLSATPHGSRSGSRPAGVVVFLMLFLTALLPGSPGAPLLEAQDPTTGAGSDATGTRMLRQPTVSDTRIAFVHANDVWVVGRDGGDAMRLTSARGGETNPHFSDDGEWIAFSGQYAGNTDVYLVRARGGQPVRLTWHPGQDVVQGWTPDGRILFQSGREGQPTKLWQLYAVSPEGGAPEKLAIPQAYAGELSADGAMVAYQELGFWDPGWRNHRGGQARPISVVDMETYERRTPPWEGERQTDPVWLDGVVYYLSERDWANNVWSWDPVTGEERQRTFHAQFDVQSIDAGGGAIVYEQGGWLHLLDPATDEASRIPVHVRGDMNWARKRWESPRPTQLANASLSPTGKRALFEFRGEVLTVPAEHGSWRAITRSSGSADRHPTWSPDGQSIAWFSDADGEYALMIGSQDGAGEPRRIAISDPTFYFNPVWSPDGARIAFTDTDMRLLYVDVESGETTHVDTERYAHPERSMQPVWSPDGRWIAYARRLDSHLRAIFIHDTRTGETRRFTDGMADAITPVWDASGDYLYFLASTDFALNTGWLDMTSYGRPPTYSLWAALLEDDMASPMLPRSDEEPQPEEAREDTDEESGEGPVGPGGKPLPTVEIDFQGAQDRFVDLGMPTRTYTGLVAGPEGHVFVMEDVPNESGAAVHRYSLEEREADEWQTGVHFASTSMDRSKVLLRRGQRWSVAPASGPAPQNGGEALDVGGLRIEVDPPAEWAQMLRDTWRFMRDFLYVDNQHGAPWDEIWEWYSPWLEGVRHRSDLNHLIDMISAEISVGHSYVRGGDFPDLQDVGTGLLGADLEADGDFYRIARLYDGEDWNPGLRGPLTHPGLGVQEGHYLLAVDGEPLRVPDNPLRLLEGRADREVRLLVNDEPSTEGARTIVVVPANSDGQLRTWAWVAENQRRVDEMSDGRLAYVWLPNTGGGGYSFFNRMYFAQQDRQGAVIDERNNGGGSAADYIVEVLSRELHGYFNSRVGDHRPFTQPIAGLWGPKVMLINGRSGSGGDLLPYLFRAEEVGPLIGTLTWGGLVGTWDTPPLVDGGRFVAPRGGFYDVNGEWAVEGEGVAPDIEVWNDPAPVIAGGDPQLERAVEEALRLLETEAVELAPEPAPPVKWRRPERSEGGYDGSGGGSGG